MRIVFAAIPGYGHLYPMLPLATACAHAGHEVFVATGDPFLGRLPLPTVPGIPDGTELDEVIEETRRRHPDAHSHDLSIAMFADTSAELVSGVLDGLLIDLRPDLVVYEAMNVGAAMAADVHDIPAVAFSIGIVRFAAERIHAATRDHRSSFWSDRGRTPPVGSGLMALALVDPVPPSLAVSDGPPVGPIRELPIRSVAYAEAAAPAPEWLSRRRSRPAIYLTLGTVAFGAVAVIRRAIEQIARLDVDLLVAVGPYGDPAAIGPVPANVHLERFVPQPEVLRSVDLIVHHGGTGTVLGAAAAGLPQLILPQGADQFFNADVITRAGAGRSLLNDAQSDGAISRAVEAMLGECSERTSAGRLRAEIAWMPEPADVVGDLVRLVG